MQASPSRDLGCSRWTPTHRTFSDWTAFCTRICVRHGSCVVLRQPESPLRAFCLPVPTPSHRSRRRVVPCIPSRTGPRNTTKERIVTHPISVLQVLYHIPSGLLLQRRSRCSSSEQEKERSIQPHVGP